jgi:hypothetical protein
MDGNYLQPRALEQNRQEGVMTGIQSGTCECAGHKIKKEKSQQKGTNWIPVLKGVGAENKEERGRQQFRRMFLKKPKQNEIKIICRKYPSSWNMWMP